MLEALVDQASEKLHDLYELNRGGHNHEAQPSRERLPSGETDSEEEEIKRRISHESDRLK
jgi:hypothetical protein